jgi:hypothetical protein
MREKRRGLLLGFEGELSGLHSLERTKLNDKIYYVGLEVIGRQQQQKQHLWRSSRS